jgi:hypothetical protein
MKKNSIEKCFLNLCKFCSHLDKKFIDKCTEELNDDISLEEMNEIVLNIRDITLPTKHTYSQQNLFVRCQMLNYIDRICSNLDISDDTFFIAVDIFDEVSKKFNFSLTNDDFTLIGLTSIFLACKIYDGKSIDLNFMMETLGQGKFERDDFLMTEILILKTLNFRIPKNYFVDFVNCTLKFILPSLTCIKSRELYRKIKDNYKKSLYQAFEKNDVLMYYLSIIYNTIARSDKLFDNALIIANLTKLAKFYKIRFNTGIEYRRKTFLLNSRENISDYKM